MVVEKNIKGVCQVLLCTHDANCIMFNKRICSHCFKRIKSNRPKLDFLCWKEEDVNER